MGKLRNKLFIVAMAAAVVAGCGRDEPEPVVAEAPLRADGPLIAAVMPNVPPYTYLDPETGEVKGIDLDIVKAAAALLGRDLEVHVLPFADILVSVKNGTADFGAAALTITEGRQRDADFSESYAEEGCAFLYRATDTPPTMIRAESLRVGVVESMTCDFYLTRHGLDPIRFTGLPEIVSNLVSGRLDAIFYDRPALITEAEASGGTLAVTPLETREHYGIAVRKGCPELLEAVNAVIRERAKKGGAK